MSIDFYPCVIRPAKNGHEVVPCKPWKEMDDLTMNLANMNAYAFAHAMGWVIDEGAMDEIEIDKVIKTLNMELRNSVFGHYVVRLLAIAERGKALGATHITAA